MLLLSCIEAGQEIAYDAVVYLLHELPVAIANGVLGLHAMNGPMLGLRQAPLTLSAGWIYFHFAKTNKSGVNSYLESGAVPFELFANRVALEAVRSNEKRRDEVALTMTFIPGASPEELI